jgi:hypothetical protein
MPNFADSQNRDVLSDLLDIVLREPQRSIHGMLDELQPNLAQSPSLTISSPRKSPMSHRG